MKRFLKRIVPVLLALMVVVGSLQPAFAAGSTATVKAAATTTAKTAALKTPTVKGAVKNSLPRLTWSAVSGAKKYIVYRATSQNGKYTKIATVTAKAYTDKKAAAGKVYYYKVKAVSAAGKTSAASKAVKVSVPLGKPTAKVVLKNGLPKVSWSAVKGASKYIVYRSETKSGKYTKITTTTKKAYTDKTAKAGKTYYYKVKAVSASKVTSTASAAVKLSLPAPVDEGGNPPPPPSGDNGEALPPPPAGGEGNEPPIDPATGRPAPPPEGGEGKEPPIDPATGRPALPPQ